jgi:hypothetical protein
MQKLLELKSLAWRNMETVLIFTLVASRFTLLTAICWSFTGLVKKAESCTAINQKGLESRSYQ